MSTATNNDLPDKTYEFPSRGRATCPARLTVVARRRNTKQIYDLLTWGRMVAIRKMNETYGSPHDVKTCIMDLCSVYSSGSISVSQSRINLPWPSTCSTRM